MAGKLMGRSPLETNPGGSKKSLEDFLENTNTQAVPGPIKPESLGLYPAISFSKSFLGDADMQPELRKETLLPTGY